MLGFLFLNEFYYLKRCIRKIENGEKTEKGNLIPRGAVLPDLSHQKNYSTSLETWLSAIPTADMVSN